MAPTACQLRRRAPTVHWTRCCARPASKTPIVLSSAVARSMGGPGRAWTAVGGQCPACVQHALPTSAVVGQALQPCSKDACGQLSTRRFLRVIQGDGQHCMQRQKASEITDAWALPWTWASVCAAVRGLSDNTARCKPRADAQQRLTGLSGAAAASRTNCCCRGRSCQTCKAAGVCVKYFDTIQRHTYIWQS